MCVFLQNKKNFKNFEQKSEFFLFEDKIMNAKFSIYVIELYCVANTISIKLNFQSFSLQNLLWEKCFDKTIW